MSAIVANCAINLECELTKPVKVQYIDGNMFSMDNAGNTAHVYVYYNGQPQEIVGTISAEVIRADGATVAVTGAMSGNRAYVIFPQAAYAVPGVLSCVIKATEGTTTTTIAAFVTNVYRSSTDTVVDPGQIIPSISAAIGSIPADYSALLASIAANYSPSKPYPVGAYCWEAGVLKRCIVPITAAETYTAAHWTDAVIGDDLSALKSAFDSVAVKDNPFETTWEIGGLNGSGAGATASNRVRNKPAFTVRPMQRIEADSSVEIRIAYYNTTNSTFDHWNSTGYETGIFHLEYGYKARIVARYAADPTSDIESATPFYSLVKIITSTYKNIPEVDDTLSVSGAAADAKKTGDEINQLYGLSIVQTEIPVEYVSGGLNGTTWGVTSDNTRIRLKGTTTPKMKTGDIVEIDPVYEARVIASINPGYGKSVVGVVTGENWVSGVVTIPEQYNGKYIGVLIRKVGHLSDDISADVSTMSDYVKLYSIETTAQNTERNTLSGLTFSILGDSISALKDYIPAGNEHYYSGSNHGVTSVNQMWWKVLADSTGATPLIMNAWSGSAVTQLEDSSHISKVPMSDDSRCYALHAYVQVNQGDTGAIEVTSENIADIVTSPFFPAYTPAVGDYVKKVDPDIVIIAGGVNDYTYAESAQSEALPWNGKTTPVISASFTEAYACMIKKIQYAYPSAIIVALSTWFTMRGDDNGYTLTHTVGSNVYTQTDYNDAIRAVAEQMHIPYMDVSNIGFNRNNFYPTYASDSSTIPTHPNAAGQFVMGRAITRRIVPLVKGFKDQ